MKVVKILIAALIAIGAGYWAYDSTRELTFSGSQIEFSISQGNIASITHSADNPASVTMSGRSTFSVVSSDTEFSDSSTREGSGRNSVYRYQAEVPAGTFDFRISRGNNVTVSIEADAPVEAVMTPLSYEDARNTVIVAVVVVLVMLFYISRIFQHRWLKILAQKVLKNDKMLPQQPSPVDVSR